MVRDQINKKMLALLSTGHMITDISQGALPIILTAAKPLFGLSDMQVGLTVLVFNLSSSVIQPLFGALSDRFLLAWLVPLGCLLAGFGMALTGYSPNYGLLLLATLISGLGVAAYHPEGSKFARYFSGARKATGMSFFSVGGNVGFAVGPLLASLLLALAGQPGTAGLALVSGTMALVLWSSLSRLKSAGVQVRDSGSQAKTDNPAEKPRIALRVIVALTLLLTVVVIRSWINLGIATFLPQYYVYYLRESSVLAAVLTSVYLFGGAIGTLVGGRLADRWGLKTVIIISMALLPPLIYLLTIATGIWSFLVMVCTGFAVISTFAVTVVFGQELLPNNVGLASGLTLGLGIGLGGVGTTVLGWVADLYGLPAMFHAMAVFPIAGLLLTLFLPGRREMRNREAESR
ncbi:MAG: MFS transporter [Firmicutes bacterium]|nr:MFS transporter [Bacillota bacterium]